MLKDGSYYFRLNILIPVYKNGKVIRKTIHICYMKQVPWQPEVSKTFSNLRTQITNLSMNPLVNKCAFNLRNHPGIRHGGKRVFVDPHFLEKHSVNWWSLDRLTEVIKNRGSFKGHRFRKSFLPMLNIIVSKLSKFYV